MDRDRLIAEMTTKVGSRRHGQGTAHASGGTRSGSRCLARTGRAPGGGGEDRCRDYSNKDAHDAR